MTAAQSTPISPFRRCLIATASFLALSVAGPAVAQSGGSKDILVVPLNEAGPVQLRIDGIPPSVTIGQDVQFCVTASRDGFISMWNYGTSGRPPLRILPYTPDGPPVPVRANERVCAGTPQDRYAYKVGGPTGMEDTYAVWTATQEGHPRTSIIQDNRSFTKDIGVVERLDRSTWSTAKVTYQIIDPTAASAPVAAFPTAPAPGGRTWVLAMGADTYDLTKTAQDATRFAEGAQRLFQVPAGQLRLIRRTYRRDFEEGMRWLRENVRPGDLVFIMFSGHGSTVRDDDGDEADGLDEVFVTYDIETTPNPGRNQVVTDDQFAQWLAAIPTERIVTIIDACHAAGLQKGLLGVRTKALPKDLTNGAGPAPVRIGAGGGDSAGGLDRDRLRGVVLAAAQESEFALEDADGGIWANALLRSWSDGRAATLRQSFDNAAADARRRSGNRQTPNAAGDLNILDTVRLR